MKFLLAIGLVTTAYSLFLVYQTRQSCYASLQQMLQEQAELMMAFESGIEETWGRSLEQCAEGPLQAAGSVPLREPVKAILDAVRSRYPNAIVSADGDDLKRLLEQAGHSERSVLGLFQTDSSRETVDHFMTMNGQRYLGKFIRISNARGERNETGLRMVAFPMSDYRRKVNEQILTRFSASMFALLVLLGAIYLSFEILAGGPLKKIVRYFTQTAQCEEDFTFTPLDIRSRDEVGLLASSFNQLGSKLDNMYRNLEANVRKRTFELQHVNRRLRHKITECRQAEEQMRVLANEAVAANHAKSEFLANISHELRTPMNAIMGFGQLLSEDLLNGEQHSYVKMIYSNSRVLLGIINDVLDFSKIEAGKLKIEPADCSIGRIIDEVESTLRPMAIKKGLRFEILQCEMVPEIIQTDSLRLRQCLINLISNAIKFTLVGYVYVNVTLEKVGNETYLRFDVEDTGIGIPDDKLPIIFDSFTQADSSSTRRYGGTGLGLAITKRLLKLMGGRISVESAVGKGSIFTMTIPICVKWPHAEAGMWNKYKQVDIINELSELEKGHMMYNGKVLVAEDNPSNQKLIAILLKKMGLEVILADDGLQVLERCAEEKYDLILMDMQMPNMNGYDATRQLRSKGVKGPIIAVTANAMMGDEKKCLDAGCDGYLSKPIERSKLDEIISQYLAVQVG